MPSRTTQTGGFFVGAVISFVLVSVIVGEFYGFMQLYNIHPIAGSQNESRGVPKASVPAPTIEGNQFRSLTHSVAFTYPFAWSATTTGYSGAEFVAELSEIEPLDTMPGQILVYRISSDMGLDSYAEIVRNQMKEHEEQLIEDQFTASGIYVLSGSSKTTYGDHYFTQMHAVFIIPQPAHGGDGKGFVVVDLYDNLDSYESSLKVLGDHVFPTLSQ